MEYQQTFKNRLLITINMSNIANPVFLKWAGGKTQLLQEYKKHFPLRFNNYFEPFLGAGAMFFFINQIYQPKKSIISDINAELINTFKTVRDRTEELLELLKKHKATNHSKEAFYEKRKSLFPVARIT